MEDAGYKSKRKKSHFFKEQADWLEHMVTENGIEPTTSKTEAFTRIPKPNNQR